jgi:hypothetical protein
MKTAAQKTVKKELPAVAPELMVKLRKKGIATLEGLSEKEQTGVWEWSRTVIKTYRSTLETDRRNVRDLAELPVSKDDIKLAIKISLPLYVSKNLQRMVQVLKNAYKELGTFQDMGRLKTEKKTLRDRLPDFLSRGDKISNPGSGTDIDLVVSEKKALAEEINNFVADLEALV